MAIPMKCLFILCSACMLLDVEAASQAGFAVNMCYNNPANASIRVQNLNSGLVIAQSIVYSIPGVISNVGSAGIDRTNKKFASGIRISDSSSESRVAIFSYSATSAALERNCTTPLTTFAGSQSPGDIHCVVYSEGRLFAVYDAAFGNGIVSEITGSCTFTTLGTSPKRVKGSSNGPGGQCVAVPSSKKIIWMDNDSNTLVVFDYVQQNFTTLVISAFDTSKTFAGFARLQGGDTFAVLIDKPDYHYISGFDLFNTVPPTVTSYANALSATSASNTDIYVDLTNPATWVFVAASSGVFSRSTSGSVTLVESLPYSASCDGTGATSFAAEYDWTTKVPYTPTTAASGAATVTTTVPTGSTPSPSSASRSGMPRRESFLMSVVLLCGLIVLGL